MMNQFFIVGRIKEKKEDGVILLVPRNFKNANGDYDNDIVEIKIKGSMKESIDSYTKANDLVGAKGRISNLGEGMKLEAEKITFLAKGGE